MHAVGLLFLAAGLAAAQEFRATLQGTITDPTTSGVPLALVCLRNADTGVERTDTSDDSGHYLFSHLAPGRYSLLVRAAGFKTAVRDGVVLSVNSNLRLDIPLSVGAMMETVSVSAEVSAVQPESSSPGATVGRQLFEDLPLRGHSSLSLFHLAAGVVSNRHAEDTRPANTMQNVLHTSSGSPPASGGVSVEGVPNKVNVNRGSNISAWVPAMDAVAEFKLQTGTLPAEYGRAGGSIMNIVIKSGTNDLHAASYEYFRNSALDANLFFPRGAGQKLEPYSVNTFGGSVDGPVLVPGRYDGRNRTFFFLHFEGSREGNGLSHTSNVPSARMRRGDFSEVSGIVYDPFSVHTVDGVPYRTPYPGKIVPVSGQDPVARRIMTYYPEPNVPSPQPNTPWVQTWVFNGKWPRNYHAFIAKFDHQTPRHQLFLRTNLGGARLEFPHQFEGIATPGRNRIERPHFGVAMNDTFAVNARTVLGVRIGYNGGRERNRPWSDGFDLASLGFPPSFTRAVQSRAFPTIAVSNFQSLAGSPLVEQNGYTWSLESSVSLQRGSHLYKTGFDGRLIRGNFLRNNAPSGSFSFNQNFTGGPRADTPVNGSGFALASLLVGYGQGSVDFISGDAVQSVYYGGYFQDDWRISRKLTLNLGLRYEYETPRTERYDRTTRGFAYNSPSPLRVPGLNLRGGLMYAGGSNPRGIYEPDRNNFAPRIGFALTLDRKTVLRGGWALSYVPVVGSVQSTGYSVTTPWVSSQDGIHPTQRFSDPFPGGLLAPVGNSLGMLTLVGEGVSFVDPSDRIPIYHNWQLSLQRELPSRSMLEIAYVGSRALRITGGPVDYATVVSEQVNQLHPSYLALGAALLEPVANPFYGVIREGPLSGPEIQYQQLLRPYPQFMGILRNSPAYGNSVYHSGQIRYEKRLMHGVTAQIAYTFSKNIHDVSNAQNAYDRRAERAVSEFDAPQRLTIAATWDLPLGRGRRFFRGAPRGVQWIVGGWQLSTMDTFQSGFPLSFTLSRPNIFAAGAGQRPNVVGDPAAGITGSINSRLSRYFNTAAFAQPANFTFGSAGPRIGSVRSPGMNNWNLRVAKDFRFKERWILGFRASSFNLMNHPVFSAPNTNFGGASFGRIFNQANLSRQTELAVKLMY